MFLFECWCWFDYEPYHKEYVMIISADKAKLDFNASIPNSRQIVRC